MNLSDDGRRRIQGYEGYHDALPDGSCKAYQRVYHGSWTCRRSATDAEGVNWVWSGCQRAEMGSWCGVVSRPERRCAFAGVQHRIGGKRSPATDVKPHRATSAGAAGSFTCGTRLAVLPEWVRQRQARKPLCFRSRRSGQAPSMPQTVLNGASSRALSIDRGRGKPPGTVTVDVRSFTITVGTDGHARRGPDGPPRERPDRVKYDPGLPNIVTPRSRAWPPRGLVLHLARGRDRTHQGGQADSSNS